MSDDKTTDDLHADMLASMPARYEKRQGFPTYDLLRAFAVACSSFWSRLLKIEAEQDVRNLTGDDLTRFVSQRKGIKRREATRATGTVIVTEGTGGVVGVGDLFATETGIAFECTVETVVQSLPCPVPVRAVDAGAIGCVPAGTIVSMPKTIQGIATVTNAAATVDGYDAESDEALLNRYLVALSEPATSGNKYHYKRWALEVPGVGDARVFPLWEGDNTVRVVLIDADKQACPVELVERVQTYIDPGKAGTGEGEAPIGAYCTVESAKALTIDVTVSIYHTGACPVSETEAAIAAGIRNYLRSIAFVRGAVSYAKIGDAILDAAGVDDYTTLTVNGGTAPRISIADDAVAVLGEVNVHVIP